MAKELSRAAHFQGTPVPVTARFSGVSATPGQKPSSIVAMATKFYLPDSPDRRAHQDGDCRAVL